MKSLVVLTVVSVVAHVSPRYAFFTDILRSNHFFGGDAFDRFDFADMDSLMPSFAKMESVFHLENTEKCRYVLTFKDKAVANMEMKINTHNPENKVMSASYSLQTVRKTKYGKSAESQFQMQSFGIDPDCLVNSSILRAQLAGFAVKKSDQEEWPNKFLIIFPETETISAYEENGVLPRGLAKLLESGKPFSISLTKLQECVLLRGTDLQWCEETLTEAEKQEMVNYSSKVDAGENEEILSSGYGEIFREKHPELVAKSIEEIQGSETAVNEAEAEEKKEIAAAEASIQADKKNIDSVVSKVSASDSDKPIEIVKTTIPAETVSKHSKVIEKHSNPAPVQDDKNKQEKQKTALSKAKLQEEQEERIASALAADHIDDKQTQFNLNPLYGRFEEL